MKMKMRSAFLFVLAKTPSRAPRDRQFACFRSQRSVIRRQQWANTQPARCSHTPGHFDGLFRAAAHTEVIKRHAWTGSTQARAGALYGCYFSNYLAPMPLNYHFDTTESSH